MQLRSTAWRSNKKMQWMRDANQTAGLQNSRYRFCLACQTAPRPGTTLQTRVKHGTNQWFTVCERIRFVLSVLPACSVLCRRSLTAGSESDMTAFHSKLAAPAPMLSRPPAVQERSTLAVSPAVSTAFTALLGGLWCYVCAYLSTPKACMASGTGQRPLWSTGALYSCA